MNPDEEMDDVDEQHPVDLNNFVWADGYGPEFITGSAPVNGGGDVPNMAHLNVITP